jgi:hypothetical protein
MADLSSVDRRSTTWNETFKALKSNVIWSQIVVKMYFSIGQTGVPVGYE